jgi:hypothetical protein
LTRIVLRIGFSYLKCNAFFVFMQGTATLVASLVGTDQSQAVTSMLAGAVLVCPIVYFENCSPFVEAFMNVWDPVRFFSILADQEYSCLIYWTFSRATGLISLSPLCQNVFGRRTGPRNVSKLWQTIDSAQCSRIDNQSR